MRTERTITNNITIPPHKLHVAEQYIEKELSKLEGRNYSGDIGFVYKILDVLKIEASAIVKNNFTGSIVYKVEFKVECINPKAGDEIECVIVQNNSILLGDNKPLKVIIIQEPNLPTLNIGEKVKVQILVTEVNYNIEYIKVVARFVSKI